MHQIESDFLAISHKRDNFILRDAQIDIAKEIYAFIKKETQDPSLVIEAGTGIGKSLAYLVPLIRANKKIIISTNTKALQKQLVNELRFLQKLFTGLTFKILQGASNYACLLKAENIQNAIIQNWTKSQIKTGQGMIDDFKKGNTKFKKVLWDEIATDSNLCQSKCPHFDQCFFQRAKIDAHQAEIVVMNHDLLLLNYKADSEFIKQAEAIVLDEAHHFPEKTRNAFTVTLTDTRIHKHIQMLNWKLKHIYKSRLEFDIDDYELLQETIFDFFPAEEQEIKLKEFQPELIDTVHKLRNKLAADASSLHESQEKDKVLLEQISNDLKRIFLDTDDNWIKVYTGKKGDKRVEQILEAIPLDTAPLLKPLFDAKPVTLTSATLRSGVSFEFFKNQIGQPNAKTIMHPSPFDKNNVMLYLPKDPIDPIQPAYHQNLTNHMINIHTKMKGRSLFLFTNKEDLETCKKLLPENLKNQFYFQTHTAEVPNMVATLQSQDNISLAGLSTLWEGIDVVGKSLSCVCIMRMPFSNPEDIVFSSIKEKSGNGYEFFETYELPQMLLKLKQGFGRLIRHETDTGLLVLLDNRFLRRKYKNRIIELLEQYNCYTDIDEAINKIPSLNSARFCKISEIIK